MKPVSRLLYDGYQFQLRGKFEEAARLYRKILRAEPKNADVMILLGIALDRLKQYAEAVNLYDQAIGIKPDSPQAHFNRALSLFNLYRLEDAAAAYRKAWELKPDLPHALSRYADLQRQLCDWRDYDRLERDVLAAAVDPGMVFHPSVILQFTDDPAIHLAAARSFVASMNLTAARPRPPYLSKQQDSKRIHLAYLSGDFRDHAVGHILIDLIENHDRSRFEVTAISTGRNDGSTFRKRYEKSFDRFIDAHTRTDEEIARRIAPLDIDILVDLMGHTALARYELLAARPAPIQVNFLGYPGTSGASFVDYNLVDPFVVPPAEQAFFTEKLVHLPDCYQPNGSKRDVAGRTPARSECGLPEQGFVFCSFNNSLKITPRVFDIWMRLLRRVPGSVLWLVKPSEVVERNLRREAEARGIDPTRLAFSPRVEFPDYLALHRHADLFLDTQPWNAHGTASHALWSGLPIVTCATRSFAGRVAGSLLRTAGLPELVTASLEDYESLAFALANNPEKLRELHERLVRNQDTSPLYDIGRYCRHIEQAYATMVEIWRRGEPPRAFTIEPIGRSA
jgi:predicted O-linked N-acetylglucosamine transferase (SPINDLY family)